MKKNEQHIDELLSKVKSGDNIAFEKLVSEYTPLLYSCVSSCAEKLRQPDREEMMQDACVALYHAALSYHILSDGVTFGLYAKICIGNALVSGYLRRRTVPTCSLEEMNESDRSDAFPVCDIPQEVIRAEAVTQLYEHMKRELSPFEYDVCMLRAQGMTTSEIASSLKKTIKAVSNALGRALNKLRGRL